MMHAIQQVARAAAVAIFAAAARAIARLACARGVTLGGVFRILDIDQPKGVRSGAGSRVIVAISVTANWRPGHVQAA